jgi:hypothetical protein
MREGRVIGNNRLQVGFRKVASDRPEYKAWLVGEVFDLDITALHGSSVEDKEVLPALARFKVLVDSSPKGDRQADLSYVSDCQ